MVKFSVRNSDLIAFLEKCACKGVVLITDTDKTTKNFFNYFYMDIIKGEEEDDGYIWVKAIDSEERRMFVRHKLSNVSIEKAGRFAINDADMLLSVLKSIPTSRDINFEMIEKDTILRIETVEGKPYYGYDIRQISLPEDIQTALENNTTELDKWNSYHTIDEKCNCPKFTIPEGSALYNTVIELSKIELYKVLRDSISLTKDQDLKFSMYKDKKEWKIKFETGKKADNIRTTAEFEKTIENPIAFSRKIITNLHPIVSHLFNNSTLYMRVAGDGALKYWIISREGNIELNFCSSST